MFTYFLYFSIIIIFLYQFLPNHNEIPRDAYLRFYLCLHIVSFYAFLLMFTNLHLLYFDLILPIFTYLCSVLQNFAYFYHLFVPISYICVFILTTFHLIITKFQEMPTSVCASFFLCFLEGLEGLFPGVVMIRGKGSF